MGQLLDCCSIANARGGSRLSNRRNSIRSEPSACRAIMAPLSRSMHPSVQVRSAAISQVYGSDEPDNRVQPAVQFDAIIQG